MLLGLELLAFALVVVGTVAAWKGYWRGASLADAAAIVALCTRNLIGRS